MSLAQRLGGRFPEHVGRLPKLIRPDQPVKGIAGLAFRLDSVTLDLAFAGDVFEMDNQRNWSDASFKTYCGP